MVPMSKLWVFKPWKRNKQEELVGSECYDITGISKAWWNESHSWSAGREGQARQVTWFTLYVKGEV